MKINDMTREEIDAKVASGEIDLYDIVDVDWSTVHFECDEEDEEVAVKPKKKTPKQPQGAPRSFRVMIRLHNGKVYQWAEIPARDDLSAEDHADEIFFDFFQKLNKRLVHIRKPVHRAIRCSIVDELYIEPVF